MLLLYVAIFAWCFIICYITQVIRGFLGIRANTWLGNERHGRTVADFISTARYDSDESLAIFTLKGRKVLESTNFRNKSVDVTRNMVNYSRIFRGVVVVHNHPDDASFSLGDLLALRRFHAVWGVVVSPVALYLVHPRSGWGTRDDISLAVMAHIDKMDLLNPDAPPEEWKYNNTHEAMSLIAQDLNYEYERRELT